MPRVTIELRRARGSGIADGPLGRSLFAESEIVERGGVLVADCVCVCDGRRRDTAEERRRWSISAGPDCSASSMSSALFS